MAKAFVSPSKNINAVIRKEVVSVVREVLSDPDAGFELKPNFIRRLKKSLKDQKTKRVTPLLGVLKQYDI